MTIDTAAVELMGPIMVSDAVHMLMGWVAVKKCSGCAALFIGCRPGAMQCSVIKSSACGDGGITQQCVVRCSWCRDMSFWAERQKEERFKLDEEYLRQFLPLESVLQGLFNVRGSCGRQLSGLNQDVEVA